jgi:hypothetical protein
MGAGRNRAVDACSNAEFAFGSGAIFAADWTSHWRDR